MRFTAAVTTAFAAGSGLVGVADSFALGPGTALFPVAAPGTSRSPCSPMLSSWDRGDRRSTWEAGKNTRANQEALASTLTLTSTATRRHSETALAAKGRDSGDADGEGEVRPRQVDGVGGFGSNVLLLVSLFLVVRGLFLPEDVRHLSFCPPEDPIRGRDTLVWRILEETGRECSDIQDVMVKYITAPIAIPGTPEWGVMLNVKEDMMRQGY